MLPTTKTILLSSSISNILPKGCTFCLIPCPQRSCEVAVPPTQNVFFCSSSPGWILHFYHFLAQMSPPQRGLLWP